MAQRIQTLCDAHQARDEMVDGFTWSVSITPPGGRPQAYDVDLCDDDGKGLSDLLAMLAELGRKADRPKAPKAAATAGSAGGQAAAAKAKENAPYVCPECGDDFATPQGRGTHRRTRHGVAGTSEESERRARAAAQAASGSDE